MGLSEAHRQAEALFESQTVMEIREARIQDATINCTNHMHCSFQDSVMW